MRKPDIIDVPMQRGTFGARGAVLFYSPFPIPSDATVSLATTNLAPTNLSKTTADGSLTIGPNDVVTWLPTSQEVASIPMGRWTRYYVEITYADGSGLRFIEGYLVGKGF